MRVCQFDGCTRPHHSQGWCSPHYKQSLRGSEMRAVTPAAQTKPRRKRPPAGPITSGETGRIVEGLVARGWTVTQIAAHLDVAESTLNRWRARNGRAPDVLKDLWRGYKDYPTAAKMFTDLSARGWTGTMLARRLRARRSAVQAWLTDTAKITMPGLIHDIHDVWQTGAGPVGPIVHGNRQHRSSPPPETWDPDNERLCKLSPTTWDGENVDDREYAAAKCLQCPVLDACRAARDIDLAEGIDISGVIAGDWLPHRAPKEEVSVA